MPFRQLDIDAENGYPGITLSESENGIALLVRRNRRPAAYWIERLPPETALSEIEVADAIARSAGEDFIRLGLERNIDLQQTGALSSLTVAICTHDRPERLDRCLSSLRNLEIPEGMNRPQILVVDNAPSDSATYDVVKKHPGVRYVVEPVPGLNFGRQRALEESDAEWIAYLDDDVVVDPIWLTGLAKVWREHSDAVAITGLVLALELETEAQILFELSGGFRRGCVSKRFELATSGARGAVAGTGVFGAGANMAFRTDVLRSLGGFDPALDTGHPLPGGGDLDIFYRVVRHGHPLVYEPSALVFHEHRRELEALRYQYYTWGLGFMAYVQKHVQEDREMRAQFLSLLYWWSKYQLRRIASSLLGRHPLPLQMILSELAGAAVGIAGEYARSRLRVEERVRKFAKTSDT